MYHNISTHVILCNLLAHFPVLDGSDGFAAHISCLHA